MDVKTLTPRDVIRVHLKQTGAIVTGTVHEVKRDRVSLMADMGWYTGKLDRIPSNRANRDSFMNIAFDQIASCEHLGRERYTPITKG